MARKALLVFLLAAVGGCTGESDPGEDEIDPNGPDPRRDPVEPDPACEELQIEMIAELSAVQHCEDDTDCGQVLSGTSCGCTRDLVARNDADTEYLYGLVEESNRLECDVGLGSTCDCPDADGFVCDGRVCRWNYVEAPEEEPPCEYYGYN